MHAVTVSNSLHLTVTCSPEGDPNVTVTSCIPEWFPFYHLCLDPPQSLDIAPTPDGQWNLSWSCHHYLHMAGNREYEIQFKLSEEPWEVRGLVFTQRDHAKLEASKYHGLRGYEPENKKTRDHAMVQYCV
ncbi:hypothetical protein FKM82_030490 [Ascaphus truei]